MRRAETIPNKEMSPGEYFNAVKRVIGVKSDNKLAAHLGTGSGMISKIRSGKSSVPVITATRIAVTLDIDPITVIADIEAQQEKDPEKRKFWRDFHWRAG
jgi:transcriptional regulator with XRE-family HTH domain